MRIALALGGLAVLAAAAIVANLALLGYAQPADDPVGKLSPRIEATAPPPVVSPHDGDDDGVEHDEDD